MQTLKESESYRLHTQTYGAKVGRDIDLILLGRVDYSQLTSKIAESFLYQIQTLCYTELYGAVNLLPTVDQFHKTGTLTTATKQSFDELISDVATANGTDVVIMGTKVALKKLNALSDVNWRAESQKEAVANTGRLGFYEGTELIEIPQRFEFNDVTKKLVDDDMLIIFPKGEEKFIKFTDKGETMIVERGAEKADLADDWRTYEVQRNYGVACVLGNYFGSWMLA